MENEEQFALWVDSCSFTSINCEKKYMNHKKLQEHLKIIKFSENTYIWGSLYVFKLVIESLISLQVGVY